MLPATQTPQRVQNDTKIRNFLLQMFEQEQRIRTNKTNRRPIMMVRIGAHKILSGPD